MSNYLVLARKYRPRTFPELVGQEVVTRVLTGALTERRLGHAYLFSGPRGTGKTTTARIFAKCLNCETGPTATPCGTCERCQAADSGQEPDIIELDAASHTGVDHIRALRDEVAYAPMRARYKVYIVDEVHMLSKPAFNALLKTLEEPPEHVVFLFATTEPHKVLDTILSRCQVLRLDPISEERIASRLTEVFRSEGVQAQEGVAEELARGARGGMRDALSLADKLLALAGENPTLEDLQRLGGGGGSRAIDQLLDILESQDRPQLLSTIGEHQGGEVELVDALLGRLRAAVVLSHCGRETPLVSGSPEERERAVERAQRLGVGRLELWMQELLRCRERMRAFSGQERVVLEVALLELARPESTWSLDELAERVEALAVGLVGSSPPTAAMAPSVSPSAPPRPETPHTAAPPPESSRPQAASSGTPAPQVEPVAAWKAALKSLAGTHGAFASLLQEVAKPKASECGIDVQLGPLDAKAARLVEDRRSRSALTRALESAAGRPLELRFIAGAPERHTPRTRPDSKAEPRVATDSPPADSSPAAAPPAAPGPPEKSAPKRSPGPQRSGASARPKDRFTQDVADLFGGVVEDM